MSKRFDPRNRPSVPVAKEERRLGPSPRGASNARGVIIGVILGGSLWIVALLLYFT